MVAVILRSNVTISSVVVAVILTFAFDKIVEFVVFIICFSFTDNIIVNTHWVVIDK